MLLLTCETKIKACESGGQAGLCTCTSTYASDAGVAPGPLLLLLLVVLLAAALHRRGLPHSRELLLSLLRGSEHPYPSSSAAAA